MHPHLHTKDNQDPCGEVMRLLDECHARGFIYKVLGNCNKAKRDVNMCLRAERLERTAKNRASAKKEREKIEKKWKEIDMNS
jgi:COX assembly protein 2